MLSAQPSQHQLSIDAVAKPGGGSSRSDVNRMIAKEMRIRDGCKNMLR
jgi:hypothetical protein